MANPILAKGIPIYLGIIILFAFAEMIQTAVLVGSYNRNNDYPSSLYEGTLRFLVFTSVWSIFVTGAYIALFFLAASSIIASTISFFAYAALTWLFWIAGAGALTNATGGNLYCGITHMAHCYQLEGALAFAWILFILYFFLVVFLGIRVFQSRGELTSSVVA